MTTTLISGARLVLSGRVVEGSSLLLKGGRIEAIFEAGAALPPSDESIEVRGAWVTPGLVEHHIHGAGGVGFDALGDDPELAATKLLALRDFLHERGVTSFVPTLLWKPRKVSALVNALEASGLDEATVPGIHLEGPFIDMGKRGGIFTECVHAPDEALLLAILERCRGTLKLMTIAPELPGAAGLYRILERAGVLPCLGHSNALLEDVELPQGPFGITHLFNAMSGFSHRDAGLAMLPFIDRRPFVELNADGVHVGASALRAAASALDPGRLILISDAVVAAGLPHGDYPYYDSIVRSGVDGVRYADSGVLMGSNRLAPEVLRNWLAVTGAAVPPAVAALSLNPWTALGGAEKRGSIEVGQEARLVIWEGQFESARLVLG
ncbi:MAG: amidohydrolase family protein [Spirochaetota bacterium]